MDAQWDLREREKERERHTHTHTHTQMGACGKDKTELVMLKK